MFTWSNETETIRMRTKKESVKFPNSVTPKTHLKVGKMVEVLSRDVNETS